MATAASLTQAAKQSWTNLSTLSIAGTLRARLLTFCSTILPLYPQGEAAGHPVADWIAVLQGFATNMAATATNWPLLRIAADLVYRLCFMAEQLTTALPSQTTATLVAYNANF